MMVVPPGTFLAGTLRLLSRVELRVETGEILLGSTNFADHQLDGVRRGWCSPPKRQTQSRVAGSPTRAAEPACTTSADHSMRVFWCLASCQPGMRPGLRGALIEEAARPTNRNPDGNLRGAGAVPGVNRRNGCGGSWTCPGAEPMGCTCKKLRINAGVTLGLLCRRIREKFSPPPRGPSKQPRGCVTSLCARASASAS